MAVAKSLGLRPKPLFHSFLPTKSAKRVKKIFCGGRRPPATPAYGDFAITMERGVLLCEQGRWPPRAPPLAGAAPRQTTPGMPVVWTVGGACLPIYIGFECLPQPCG